MQVRDGVGAVYNGGPELPQLNEALMRKTLDWVRDEAKKDRGNRDWDQTAWFKPKSILSKITARWRDQNIEMLTVDCKTGMCFAGHAVSLAGDVFVMPVGMELSSHGEYVLDDQNQIRGVQGRAAELLGLTNYEAGDLFSAGNKLEDIETKINSICEVRGVTL